MHCLRRRAHLDHEDTAAGGEFGNASGKPRSASLVFSPHRACPGPASGAAAELPCSHPGGCAHLARWHEERHIRVFRGQLSRATAAAAHGERKSPVSHLRSDKGGVGNTHPLNQREVSLLRHEVLVALGRTGQHLRFISEDR